MFSSICIRTKFGKYPRQRIFRLFHGPFLCREVATVVHPPMKEASRGHPTNWQSVVCPPSQWPQCEIRRENNIWQWGWQRYSTRLKSFKRRGRRRRERFLHYFLKIQKYVFWKYKIISFENADLRNLIKARRGEIEPTHDFTFSLIGRLL